MKTREDFIGAANHAYDIYQKFMFITARDFFGIPDPTVEAVTEFELRNPIAATMTDSKLYFAGKTLSDILQTGWEVYIDASGGRENLLHGISDDQDRWVGWMDEPAGLPSKIRLGDHVMDAEWQVYRRYTNRDDVRAIAGVKFYCFEGPDSRATFDSLVHEIGKTLGTPLAPYQPGLPPSVLPSGLLWTSFTVRVLLTVTNRPADEDEGIDAYRTYHITISRNEAHDGAFHFGCAAEQLLK